MGGGPQQFGVDAEQVPALFKELARRRSASSFLRLAWSSNLVDVSSASAACTSRGSSTARSHGTGPPSSRWWASPPTRRIRQFRAGNPAQLPDSYRQPDGRGSNGNCDRQRTLHPRSIFWVTASRCRLPMLETWSRSSKPEHTDSLRVRQRS